MPSRGLVGLVLSLLLFIQLLRIRNRQVRMNTTNETGQRVYFLLMEYGVSFEMARMITAQAAHETANFTSRILRENNNLFGMKLALIRQTTAKGQKNGYANYDSIEDSVKDYILYYQSFRYQKKYDTISQFVSALVENNYFEADRIEYENGMNFFYNLYFRAA